MTCMYWMYMICTRTWHISISIYTFLQVNHARTRVEGGLRNTDGVYVTVGRANSTTVYLCYGGEASAKRQHGYNA